MIFKIFYLLYFASTANQAVKFIFPYIFQHSGSPNLEYFFDPNQSLLFNRYHGHVPSYRFAIGGIATLF